MDALLENNYLKYYNRVFKAELLVYFSLGNVMGYLFMAYTFRSFSMKMLMSILAPGFLLNIYCIYARSFKSKDFELQI